MGLLDDAGDGRRTAQRCPARVRRTAARQRPPAVHSGEETFGEHLVFISAPGHTPGHVAVGISDRGERAVIIGDASHHPVHVAHPDWRSPLDWDGAMAATSRDRLFDLAANDGRLLLAGHWKHPGWGRIVRLEGKRTFRAL